MKQSLISESKFYSSVVVVVVVIVGAVVVTVVVVIHVVVVDVVFEKRGKKSNFRIPLRTRKVKS